MRILKNVHELSEKIKKEGDIILEDVRGIREDIITKGKMASSIMRGMLTIFGVASNFKKRRSKQSKNQE